MRTYSLSFWQRRPDLLALIALATLILFIHAPLVFTDAVLTDFDLFAYFYPYWEHRSASFREGVLPLWNPYLFTGVPFLANPQAAVLYPLNWPLSWLGAPRAVALAYVFHLWVAGAGMYLLLRWSFSCRPVAAGLGAGVLALGGVLAAQAGHINQVQAAAWLPWLVIAVLKGGIRWTVAGAVFYALAFLAGHPQQVFISSSGLALAAAWRMWDTRSARPLFCLAAMVVGGLGLPGAQLLPTLELSGESVRAGGLSYASAASFSLPPPELLRSLFPTYGDQPASEYVAYAGVAALLLAWHGLWFVRRSLLFALIAGAGLFLALGRFNPLYQLLYDLLPGFDLFRAPSRWLLLWGFGVAGLAAMGLDRALADSRVPKRCVLWAVLSLMAPAALIYVLVRTTAPIIMPPVETLAWWIGAGIAALAFLWLPVRSLAIAALALIVLAELYFARQPLPVSNPSPPAAYSAVRPALAHLLQDPGLHRTLTIADPGYAPGDMAELRATLPEFTPAQFQDLLAATKYLEIMTPNLGLRFGVPSLDGYDGGLLPLKRYAVMKARLLETAGAPPSADPADDEGEDLVIIRDRAMYAPDAGLLGDLNVKYLIADRLWDVWVDGVYHDLGAPVHLARGDRVRLDHSSPHNAVSLVTYLQGAAALAPGTPVARLTAGNGQPGVLRAGTETAESEAADARHGSARAAGSRRRNPQAGVYVTRLDLAGPVTVEAVQPEGTLTIAGIAFIDSRTGGSDSAPVDDRWQRVHTGDVKVYQNRLLQPRAVGGTIVSYQPQRVEVQTDGVSPNLILTDTHYPGWRATVDGTPAEIVQAGGLFRSVAVPPGEHRVVFTYEPDSLKAGIAVTLITALFLTATCIVTWRR